MNGKADGELQIVELLKELKLVGFHLVVSKLKS